MTRPVAFRDLPPDAFPFVIEFIAEHTGKIVHTIVVEEPGDIDVPPLRAAYGPIGVRIRYADGTQVVEGSSGG